MSEYAALRAEVDALKGELKAEQDFSSGILVALKQVLIQLLPPAPAAARALAADWREASADFRADPRDEAAQLEARHLLYQQLDRLGVWPPLQAPGAPR